MGRQYREDFMLITNLVSNTHTHPLPHPTQVRAQLRAAARVSPASQPDERGRRWGGVQRALEGLRVRADAINKVSVCVL
jgi:hypothetical protein